MRLPCIAFGGAVLAAGIALGTAAAQAEDMSKEQMIRSLQGKTRSIEPGAAGAAPSAAEAGAAPETAGAAPSLDSVRPSAPPRGASGPSRRDLADELRRMSRNTRQITVEERNKIAKEVVEDALPTIDVEVFFAYDSAALLPQALPKLITLGQALSDPRLKGSAFLIAGHTDAKGSDSYNLQLSNARAASVKSFLVKNFHIDPGSLFALGFGEEQLKDPDDPFSGENRRVQIVNVETANVAGR